MQFSGDFKSGEMIFITVHSHALAGNMLGDPAERKVGIYIPCDTDPEGLPLLVSLAGYTGSGLSQPGLHWSHGGVRKR